MSYSISISGHKDVASAEEAAAFEQKIARKARAFVASIEGVNSANGSFGNIGAQDLTAAAEPEPAPAVVEPGPVVEQGTAPATTATEEPPAA